MAFFIAFPSFTQTNKSSFETNYQDGELNIWPENHAGITEIDFFL